MSSAIKRLTHLYLSVRLVPHNNIQLLGSVDSCYGDKTTCSKYKEGRSSLHIDERNVKGAEPVTCPAHLEVVPREVFGMISAAVPNLQQLNLLGHCSSVALGAFGANCPQLKSLQVEANSVHMKAVHHLHSHLPNMTHLRMMRRGSCGYSLQTSTIALFSVLRYCATLTSLELDFGSGVQILCTEYNWLQPAARASKCV